MRLSWDGVGVRLFKAGVDRGVLYPMLDDIYGSGIAWNGLTSIDDSSSGRDTVSLYGLDGRRKTCSTKPDHGGVIKCYTYPDEFEDCIGNIQVAPGLFATKLLGRQFGFCYRVKIGNDVVGIEHAYEIHIVYGACVTESKTTDSTISSSFKPFEMSFNYECAVQDSSYHEPTSHLVVSSRFVNSDALAEIENILYGTANSEARLLLPDELYDIIQLYDPHANAEEAEAL